KECAFAVDQKYAGTTVENRKIVTNLPPGEVTVEVFADGFDHMTRRIRLEESQPKEEKFSLKRSTLARQLSASASLLKVVTSLGGTDGLAELGDIEGSGAMLWTNSSGQVEQWTMTFNKHIGPDLALTFKTKDGQCSASIMGTISKQECKGGLKNGGDKIAE